MYTFIVDDMSCSHCELQITRAIKSCDPKAQIAVDLPARTVTVQTAAPELELRERLAASGYPPR